MNYASMGNTDRETSYFLNMYLRDTRAVQYLKTRPDWDGKTIVLMGPSMGGQQTLVTASLNDGVTAALAWVPSGTDFNGDLHGRKIGYPTWNSKDEKIAKTGLYFDVVNFAARIKAPAFIAFGFLDTVSSPVGIWTAYNQIPGAKEAIAMPQAAHNNQAPPATERAWAIRSEEVLSTILKGGELKATGLPPQ
jgi:cephalosporin-C deacetylase-like acetyl esterase